MSISTFGAPPPRMGPGPPPQGPGGVRQATPNPAQVQKILDENAQLIGRSDWVLIFVYIVSQITTCKLII